MAISLVGATVVALPGEVPGDRVRLQFSEPFKQDAELFKDSNFAFAVRFGEIYDIYAKRIEVYAPSYADVVLSDAMLQDGHYSVTVFGVSAISDGIRIEVGAGPNTANFDGIGDGRKIFDIRRRVPSWWNTKWGATFHSLLGATGNWLETISGNTSSSMLRAIADALSVLTATGSDLSILGQNYGVTRPTFLWSDDALYRKLLPILSLRKKVILSIFYEALTAAFGDRATAGWEVFVTNPNQLDLVLPADLVFGLAPGTLASATYLHANAAVFAPPSYLGDYLCADASVAGTTVGGNIVVLFDQTVVEDIVTPLKAAGVVLTVTTL